MICMIYNIYDLHDLYNLCDIYDLYDLYDLDYDLSDVCIFANQTHLIRQPVIT